jgi:hypothetical protein
VRVEEFWFRTKWDDGLETLKFLRRVWCSRRVREERWVNRGRRRR